MCVRAPSSALGGHTESCSVRWLTAPGCLVKLLPALPAWGRVQPLPCCAFWQNQCRSFPWHGGVTVPALLLTGEGLPGPWGLLRQCVASVGLTVALFRGRDDFVAVLFFFLSNRMYEVWGSLCGVNCPMPGSVKAVSTPHVPLTPSASSPPHPVSVTKVFSQNLLLPLHPHLPDVSSTAATSVFCFALGFSSSPCYLSLPWHGPKYFVSSPLTKNLPGALLL